MYIYTYIYIYICMCTHIFIYIYIRVHLVSPPPFFPSFSLSSCSRGVLLSRQSRHVSGGPVRGVKVIHKSHKSEFLEIEEAAALAACTE